MSWNEIDLTNIPTDLDVIPEGRDYIFELLPGAKYGKFDAGRVEAAAKVVEGEFANRIVYFSYPDPSVQPWSLGVFARMVKTLGDAVAGEDPVTFLNRKAGSKFVSKVGHRIVEIDGGSTTKVELKIGNVKPYNEAA